MKIFAEKVLTATGWQNNQIITVINGNITAIVAGTPEQADIAKGIIIPGMINCHSHAFQRAFAGFSERISSQSDTNDSFWSWRAIMYKFLAQLSEQDAELIATQLYIEMVKMGYTRVAEFHYLHHDFGGERYQPLATMAKAIFSAAQQTGIGLTMLPVFYQYAGFGQQQPTQGQARFINGTEEFNQLVTECAALSSEYENTNVGIAPHSLRATDKVGIEAVVKHVRAIDAKAPIHIHIAEQQQEVNDCIDHYGKRPVQWLLDSISVDQHWCLIHATHIDDQETKAMASAGVVAGICPTTEANLGDGVFPTAEFLQHKGVLAIGSDSHISVNPVEELRWLEYAQRLTKQQRAVLANKSQISVGENLWQKATHGGALACGLDNVGEIAVGKQADFIVLDDSKLTVYAQGAEFVLDSLLFASHQMTIKDVMVNGEWVVTNYKHALEHEIKEKFTQLLTRLSA